MFGMTIYPPYINVMDCSLIPKLGARYEFIF